MFPGYILFKNRKEYGEFLAQDGYDIRRSGKHYLRNNYLMVHVTRGRNTRFFGFFKTDFGLLNDRAVEDMNNLLDLIRKVENVS